MWSTCMTFNTSSTMCINDSWDVPTLLRNRAENSICSRTVSSWWTMSSWGTKPVTLLNSEMLASTPLMWMAPVILPYVALPQRVFMNVVFPAPEGPMTAHILPALNSPVTPWRTRFPLASWRPNSLNSMSAVPAFACMPRNWYFCTLNEGMKCLTKFRAKVWLWFMMLVVFSRLTCRLRQRRSDTKIASTITPTPASQQTTP
mmetsp:Transcript_91182/g.279143  ORF Transcript_91182/g.279143 Transcript_91182/m.279143 type:complete len:202 (+) Transcript_91182:26-631(+)